MIMVRRRARPAKDVAAVANPIPNAVVLNGDNVSDMVLHGGAIANPAIVSANILDEQYFASPKRKDCRLTKTNENLKNDAAATVSEHTTTNITTNNNDGSYNKSKATTKSERAGSAGRTIGVPLATRSQTRTIENFFKANAAAKNANKMTTNSQPTEEQKTIALNTTENTTVTTSSSHQQADNEVEKQEEELHETYSIASSISPRHQDIFEEEKVELEADISSSQCTLLKTNGTDSVDFQTHRSTLRDSHSSTQSNSSATTDNIFLQEPVLTLDIDRTPSKASSIKINRSFELATAVFSSPPSALSACMLNGRFNQIVSLNGICEPPAVNFGAVPVLNAFAFELDQHDSSSCDSGVVTTTKLNTTNIDSPAGNARHRKPATPHRILCPSPIKSMPRSHDPIHMHSGSLKMASKGDPLSPRKSPRKLATADNAVSKSRRRLNQPMPQAPYQSTSTQKTQINLGEVIVVHDDDQEPEEIDDDDDVHVLLKASEEMENLNKARSANKVKTVIKPVAPKKGNAKGAKSKTYGGTMSQPLAATNRNRELTDFFPVRRSVRKTKSAVKEEMMRNLEQAVLEERAEGLLVRHFEGKGRGVVADRHFKRNEFVIEYVGDLIPITEASERERRYALDENTGCYMYYFKHKNQQYCIDATVDTGKLGRLINHSRNGNLMTKVVVIKQRPHLVLLAKDDIEPGEELTYDYGDRSKEALLHHPWLAF
ncbi:histone-lysine N-methyltransferase PR-Set7 [Scaptodrosophila lebanonensis]|uniref:Histone-lysine N-methyltransferase Set8 n=1 Tax=Drosophila lebanonensis TaxID=7225 RepID=A0A6J2T8L0_DROLE|nr:histone-lysine N-methyltransferase PR-Set7 [Scaptodrosophila lebanonensis]